MERISISSLEDPRLDCFRAMKTPPAAQGESFFAEGTTLVERLLHSTFEVQNILASEQKLRNFAARIPEGTVVYEVSRDLASELVGYKFHLGVVARARRRQSPRLNDVLPATGPSLVLLGNHLIDPENVGTLIRVAAAFGADAIVLTAGSADAFSRRVLRVSTGNGLFLPVIEDVAADEALETLYQRDFSCCATLLHSEAMPLAKFSFSERTTLLFGNETHGIQRSVADACHHRLTIPMLNGTDSLNVGIAAGIFSHSYRTQHPSPN